MSDQSQAAASPTADPESPSGSGLIGKIWIAGFILIVVAAECALAKFLIPGASETAARTQAPLAPGETTAAVLPDVPDEIGEEDETEKIEVKLGEYSVSAFQPLSNTTLRIDFQLYGTVGRDEESELQERMAASEHRLREQILVIMRSVETRDLADAGLGLIKRMILEKSNRVLGKPLIREIVFSDFSYVEQ